MERHRSGVNMDPWRRATLGQAVTVAFSIVAAVSPRAHADDVGLHLTVTGAVQTDVKVSHAADNAHFCSAAPDPWSVADAYDSRATPFPFYRVVFGQASPEDEPDAPGPSLGLALSNYFFAARNHSDPDNDSIELVIGGRHFVGHAGLTDPGYRFAVAYRVDRRGGGLVARHMHEERTGGGILDVVGSWECAPVAADLPEVAVSAHALFAGAVPVRAQPTQLRLLRATEPCPASAHARCAGWQVIDQTSGEAFMASVDLHRLHLAPAIRRQAEDGRIELLVDAKIRPGDPPRVLARWLAGVAPRATPSLAIDTADQQGATSTATIR
jgi:hypothetical protein